MRKTYQWSTDKEFKKWLKDHNKLEAWEAQMRDEGTSNYGTHKYLDCDYYDYLELKRYEKEIEKGLHLKEGYQWID